MEPVKLKLSGYDPALYDVMAGLPPVSVVETASLVASLMPVDGLFSAESIPWKAPDQWIALVAAAVNDSWGVHDLCTLTACRHPLHPGPCKGWKHTLHTVSPGAYHALEKARVEKLNSKRVAKIEALKAQGKPIPKGLLKPITYDPNALKAPPEPYGSAKPATTLKEHAPHLAKSGIHTLKVKAPPSNLPPAPSHKDGYSNAQDWAVHNAIYPSASTASKVKVWGEMNAKDWSSLSSADHKAISDQIASTWKTNPKDRHLIAAALAKAAEPGSKEHADLTAKAGNPYSDTMAQAADLHAFGNTKKATVKHDTTAQIAPKITKEEFDKLTPGEQATLKKHLQAQAEGQYGNFPSKKNEAKNALARIEGKEEDHGLTAPPPKDIGKSAELVGGEAHHASEKVSKDAGIKASHPPNPHPVGHSTAGTNGIEHHEPKAETKKESEKPKTSTTLLDVAKGKAHFTAYQQAVAQGDKETAAKELDAVAKLATNDAQKKFIQDLKDKLGNAKEGTELPGKVTLGEAIKSAKGAAAEPDKVTPKVDELNKLQKKQATNEKLSKVIHAIDSGKVGHWLPLVDGLSKDEFEKLDPIDQAYVKSALKDTAINGSNIPMQQAAMGAHEKLTGEKVAGGNKGGGLLEDLLTNGPAKLSTFSPAQNAAVDMATSKEWWAKKQLPAYEPLTKAEFQGLDKVHQDKILSDLVKGHGKFKDPAKVKATEELLTKLGHGDKIPGAPAAATKAAPPDASAVPTDAGTVSVPQNLTAADLDVIGSSHKTATQTLGMQALEYGTTSKYSKYEDLTKTDAYGKAVKQIEILSDLSSKLARALAVQKYAAEGKGHAQIVSNALSNYNDQHAHVQTLINLARAQAGLTKKKLPKLTDTAHQEKAAQLAFAKTLSSTGEHQFTGSAGYKSAKNFLHEKLPEKYATPHLSTDEKKAAKAAAKAAAPPKPTLANPKPATPAVDLGTSLADTGHIAPTTKEEILSTFKAQEKGKYLHDPTEDVYDNLVALAHVYGGKQGAPMSVSQVAKVIDEKHSANLGVANTGMLEAKLKDWLATPDGAAYAQAHATPNKDLVSNITGEIEPPKGIHLEPGEKVQKLPGPGPFDAAKPASDFKHMSNAQVRAEQDAYMAKTGTPWSAASKKALYKYTGSMYKIYNNYLRGKPVTINAKEKQEILHIQAGMRPLQSDVFLVRGTDFTNFPPGFQDKESVKQLIGKPGFEDKAFVSTATSGGFSGEVRMEIEAPKGTMGAFLDDISGHQGENEILLAAGTKFKVLSVSDSGYPTVVRVRVVGAK